MPASGFNVEIVVPSSLVLFDLRIATQPFSLDSIARQAVAAGAVLAQDAAIWMTSLQNAFDAKSFEAKLSGVVISGTTI